MRPFVVVNCAMSIDGKISLPDRKQTKISNDEDMKRVHKLRNECDAVLVGIGTVLADNPKLTVKEEYVENPSKPLRVVLDSKFRTPIDAAVLNEDAPTLIATTNKEVKEENVEVIKCGGKNINLDRLMNLLHERGIKKLLVEGGETVIWEFLKHRFVDEFYVFMAPLVIGGTKSPTVAGGVGASSIDNIIHMKLVDVKRLGGGLLVKFIPSLTENIDE